jgi:hypothetical protein
MRFELRDLHLLGKHSYHLNHTSSPFCFSYFLDRVSCCFCPGEPQTAILLPRPPTELKLQKCTTTPRLFFEIGSHFLLELSSNHNPPISAPQVAGITGVITSVQLGTHAFKCISCSFTFCCMSLVVFCLAKNYETCLYLRFCIIFR